jgi:hypothetical protein
VCMVSASSAVLISFVLQSSLGGNPRTAITRWKVRYCIYCQDLSLHSSTNFLCEGPQLATYTIVIPPDPKQAPQITGLGLALCREPAVCRTLCVWISTRTHLGFGCKQGNTKFLFGVRYD